MSSVGGVDNLTAVLFKTGDLRLQQWPLPGEPGRNEVILETVAVGICGSDVHYWKRGRIGDFIVKAPMVLGHETSGRVVKVGEGVKGLKVGDRVATEPGVPCRACCYCKEGRYNLCPDITFFATPPDHGTLTRLFKHAADFCFKLPDHVSFEEGAILEPLSVAVHACNRAGVAFGSNVLICGAGPIGLVNILTAKAFGASSICVTDINEQRLILAKKLGADSTLLIKSEDSAETLSTEVRRVMVLSPNITIECSGAESSIKLAILATRSGGTVVLVGMGSNDVTVPLVSAAVREIDIRGVFRYKNCYPTALALIAEGKINVKPLVTHRFTLEQTLEAFEAAASGEAVKVIIDCTQK